MDVFIKPDYREFLSENLGMTFLFFVSLVAMPLLTSVGGNYLQLAVSFLSLLLAVVLIIRYVMLTTVVWIVGESTFCRIRGVFSRHTDYIELYRVVDYSESQTLLQKLWRVKTVCIISTDKSDSTMQMYGVKASLDIVRLIRNRVEKCKQEKRIYEITNQ